MFETFNEASRRFQLPSIFPSPGPSSSQLPTVGFGGNTFFLVITSKQYMARVYISAFTYPKSNYQFHYSTIRNNVVLPICCYNFTTLEGTRGRAFFHRYLYQLKYLGLAQPKLNHLTTHTSADHLRFHVPNV